MATQLCAVEDCEAFRIGHRRAEACWLCWLAMRPHGWHPGESTTTSRVPALKTTPLINSEEDPGIGLPDIPLFGEVEERNAVAVMKERHGPAQVPEDEVLSESADRGMKVLPLLREVSPATSAKVTEWDVDWRI